MRTLPHSSPAASGSEHVVGGNIAGGGDTWFLTGIVIAAALWAGILYRPWIHTPFPIYDFGGLLSTFHHEESFGRIVTSLNAQYAADGRLFPLQMLVLALNWELFGDNAVGWYVARFVLLLTAIALAATLLRRFGATYLATGLAVGLFVVGNGAVQPWFNLAMSEPVGVFLILVASLVATRHQVSERPLASAASIGLLLAGAIAAKETFIAAVPFVLLVAAYRFPIATPSVPRVSRRLSQAILVVGTVIVVVNLIPIGVVLAHVQSGSYGGRYSLTGLSGGQVLTALYATTLPVTWAPHYPANVAYVCVVLAGLWTIWRRVEARRHSVAVVAGGVLLLCGVAVYAPWPGYSGYYALAFLPGSCLMLAAAVSAVQGTASKRGRAITYGAVVGILATGSALAADSAAQYRAARRVDYAVAREVGRVGSARNLIVGVRDPTSSGDFGRALATYAHYLGSARTLEARDVSCREASTRAGHLDEHTVVVWMSELCPGPSGVPGGARIAYRVATLDWRRLVRRDTAVTAEIWSAVHTSSASDDRMASSPADSYGKR